VKIFGQNGVGLKSDGTDDGTLSRRVNKTQSSYAYTNRSDGKVCMRQR